MEGFFEEELGGIGEEFEELVEVDVEGFFWGSGEGMVGERAAMAVKRAAASRPSSARSAVSSASGASGRASRTFRGLAWARRRASTAPPSTGARPVTASKTTTPSP